jgi:hypothetical protein
MGFWNDSAVDVKRAYRFLVTFGSGKGQIEQFLAKKCTLPSWSITETKHSFLNHSFYYPGRVEWQTVDLTFVDPASPDTTAKLLATLRQSGYALPESENVLETISKGDARFEGNSLGSVRIQQIDDEGQPFSSWELVNSWLKDVKLSELSYESDDIMEVTATVRYDYAKYSDSTGISPYPAGQSS